MGDNALFVLPASGPIKFSQVRDMYDQVNGADIGFKKYYRDDGGIVSSGTYTTGTANTMGNTAGDNIPTGATRTATTPLKLSQFRGAFKEHVVSVGDHHSTYTINPYTTEHRTYRYKFSGSIYHNADGYTGGIGHPGIKIDVSNEKVRLIIHLTNTGMIGGGPGAGGGPGGGGLGAFSGTAGAGATSYPNAGGNASGGTVGVAGGDGDPGGKGGDCVYIESYPTANPLSQYSVSIGRLKPGGGGGGGSGGGGGGRSGSSGGGGGKGAMGIYTYYTNAYGTNGTAGRRGVNGSKGSDGAWGSIGSYHGGNGDQIKTTSVGGYTPSPTTIGSEVEAGYASPPTTAGGYFCTPGTGGRGANGGKGGAGGGYDSGGGGGAFAYPGAWGGYGQDGYDGVNLSTVAPAGTDNGCGRNGATAGGSTLNGLAAGAGGAGGTGGAGGNLAGGNTTGISITYYNWSMAH